MSDGCPNCGSTESESDSSRGEKVCTNCGLVLDNISVVNDLSFTMDSGGRSHVGGHRVSWVGLGSSSNLRSITRGGAKIDQLACRLQLPAIASDEAKRMLTLAAQRNFTSGHRTSLVSAACLYIVCRRDCTPYMLMDFSDILRVRVKDLGRVYLKLARLLSFDKVLEIPVIDPSLFIERFVMQLSLNDREAESEVSHTAMRLVQLMSRDWICTGRRPTSLCGAALLIAARYHGYDHMTAEKISHIVRIGSVTIKKRIYELRKTPTASITYEELSTVNPDLKGYELSSEVSPPALIHNRNKEKKLQALGIDPHKNKITIGVPHGDGNECLSLTVQDSIGSSENSTKDIEELCEDVKARACVLASEFGVDSILKNLDKYQPQSREKIDREAYAKLCDKGSDVSDDSDSGVDDYILSQEESNKKEELWQECNKTFIGEWQRREQVKRERAENPEKTKKKQKIKGDLNTETSSPVSFKTSVARSRSFSSNLNIESLEYLFTGVE